MFKVFVVSFECWRFLLLLLMLKVTILILGCSKFLLLVLDVESSYFYSWILKVLTLVLGCWKFLLLLLDAEGLWFLIFCLFAYIKEKWCENSILFRSWLYKFSLTYNDERFMKGDFWMIIMLHMFLFCVWTFFMTFVVFML
jgi:hypothetical protein